MTNGEKMQAVFPDIERWGESEATLDYSLGGMLQRVTKRWWRSEYKEPTIKNDLSSGLEKNSKELENPTTKNNLGVDCIDRQATLDAIIKRLGIKNETYLLEAERAIYQQILAMPSVTPIRPKGHWIERHDDWGNGIITDRRYKCSVCHGKHIDPETGEWNEVFDYKYPFCPNCGADMREVEE